MGKKNKLKKFSDLLSYPNVYENYDPKLPKLLIGENMEAEILTQETDVDPDSAKKLVAIANKIRNLKEMGLTETVSTRLLVDSAKLIHSGLPKRLSVKVAMIEPLSDDREVVDALCDLANLMI